MTCDLLLVGGGHAHLGLLHRIPRYLARGLSIVLADPADALLYSGMVPAVIAGRVAAGAASIPFGEMAERYGARWLRERVAAIDTRAATATTVDGTTVRWRAASVATGSTVVAPVPIVEGVMPAKPLWELARAIANPATALERVAVVGGGPSAVELAAALRWRLPQSSVSLVTRGASVLEAFPDGARHATTRYLSACGIEIHTGAAIRGLARDAGSVRIETERMALAADRVVVATGLSAAGPTIDGVAYLEGIPVAGDMRYAEGDAPLFAAGDVARFLPHRIARAGVHAVRQRAIVAANVEQALGLRTGSPLTYHPPTDVLQIISLGGRNALAVRGRWWSLGRPWLALKDRIDWAFVRSGGRSTTPRFGAPPRA